ncbi:MAG: phenylalanine--tRNA ligase subunit beta [Acidiferrobacter sp.]
MRIGKQWLSDWLDSRLPFEALAAVLTRGGFEVEGAGIAGPMLPGVVVARIMATTPHPNAERLRVCEVEAGGERRTVVCGAPNARVGLKAPLALPGAVLGDRTIAETELRGVRSQGMLCSGGELGLSATEGLWELPADAPVGVALADYFRFADPYLDVAVTPNRGDCLSVKGMAREIAALTDGRYRAPRARALKTSGVTPRVAVQDPSRCPRYCARLVSGLEPAATSPGWLVECLRLSGTSARQAVVDVTNYILFDLGQPLHAFDAALIRGDVAVRLARPGEEIALLDGQTCALQATDLIIADDEGPLAIAGVMGGLRAAVGPTTRSILLEAAHFRPDTLSQTARRLGLTTEAALRFERGVDPELCGLALERATALILKIAGGVASPAAEHRMPDYWPRREPIRLRLERVRQLLGVAVPRARVARLLKGLGMTVAASHGGLLVTAPSFRFDVRGEIDLIEEVARLLGYDEIPTVELPYTPGAARSAPSGRRRAADLLVDRDYQEAMTFSLVDPGEQAQLGVSSSLALRNPLAGPWSELRASLVPGLLATALHNRRRQQGRVRLFEIGTCFTADPAGVGVREEMKIAGLALGSALPEQWGAPARPVDFFDVKGDVEALCALVGQTARVSPDGAAPFLQKGLGAAITVAGHHVGFVGGLAAGHRERLGFEEPVFVFELSASLFEAQAAGGAVEPPRFPSVRRDLAVVVPATTAAGDVLDTVRRSAGALLRGLVVFDVYHGKGLDLGKKSLALGLTLQDFSRTLTDEVVEGLVARVVESLATTYGAVLRQ